MSNLYNPYVWFEVLRRANIWSVWEKISKLKNQLSWRNAEIHDVRIERLHDCSVL
jgi:hypothetical protein